MNMLLRGTKTELIIGPTQPTVVIGNRIDASMEPGVVDAASRMDLEWFKAQAIAQLNDGADAIQLSLGGAAVDETVALPAIVEAVSVAVPVPLCIRTSNPEALRTALLACPGRPLINCVTAEERSLKNLLPVAAEAQAAVVVVGDNQTGLPYEFEGLPIQFDEDLELARMALRNTLAAGMPREDIILGVRPASLAAKPDCCVSTLALIQKLVRIEQLGFVLEPSAFSQGLENRASVEEALALAGMMAGVTCVIADPAWVVGPVRAMDIVLGKSPTQRR